MIYHGVSTLDPIPLSVGDNSMHGTENIKAAPVRYQLPEMFYYKLSIFCQMLSFGIAGLVPVYWTEVLHFSAETVAYINGFAMIIPLIAPVVFGTIGSFIHPSRPVVACYCIYSAACIGMYAFHEVFFQAGFYSLLQFARWGFFTLVPVGVLHALGPRAGQEYGTYRRVGSIGFIIGLLLAGYVADSVGLSVMLIIMAVAGIIAAVPFMSRISIPLIPQSGAGYRRLLVRPGPRYFLLGALCINSMFAFSFIFLPIRMKQMGASDFYVSFILAMCGMLALVSLRSVGTLVDRYSPFKLLLLVPVFCFLRTFLTGLPEQSLFWFGLIQLLHIPTWVLGDVLIITYLKRYCDPGSFPRMQALANIANTGGMLLGSWLVGILLDTGLCTLQTSFFYVSLVPLSGLYFFWKLEIEHQKENAVTL